MDIFEFKQKDLIEYQLGVYHALILRFLYDCNKPRISVQDIFKAYPILGDDFMLIALALATIDERGLVKCIPLKNGDGEYSYDFDIEVAESVFNKKKKIDFELFWKKYSYPIGKAVALKSWNKLSVEDQQKVMANLDSYVKSTLGKNEVEDKANWKPRRLNASTYLNQKRFLDEEVESKSEYDKMKSLAI